MAKDTYDVRIIRGERSGWVAVATVCRNYDSYLYAALDLPSYAEASVMARRLNDVAAKIAVEGRLIPTRNRVYSAIVGFAAGVSG